MRLLISLVLGLKLLPWQQSGYDSILKVFQEGKRFLIYGLSVGTVCRPSHFVVGTATVPNKKFDVNTSNFLFQLIHAIMNKVLLT